MGPPWGLRVHDTRSDGPSEEMGTIGPWQPYAAASSTCTQLARSADCSMRIQAGLSCMLSARVKCLACRRPFCTAPTAGFVASAPAADLERFAGPPFCGEPCVGSATASFLPIAAGNRVRLAGPVWLGRMLFPLPRRPFWLRASRLGSRSCELVRPRAFFFVCVSRCGVCPRGCWSEGLCVPTG